MKLLSIGLAASVLFSATPLFAYAAEPDQAGAFGFPPRYPDACDDNKLWSAQILADVVQADFLDLLGSRGTAADMSGGFTVSREGFEIIAAETSADGIPDVYGEMALLTRIVSEPSLVSGTQGFTGAEVRTAYENNLDTLLNEVFDPQRAGILTLLPQLPRLLAMSATLGGGDFTVSDEGDTIAGTGHYGLLSLRLALWGPVMDEEFASPLLIPEPPASLFTSFPQLRADGDADGDGFTNREEFAYFSSLACDGTQGNPDAISEDSYLEAALDPELTPGSDPELEAVYWTRTRAERFDFFYFSLIFVETNVAFGPAASDSYSGLQEFGPFRINPDTVPKRLDMYFEFECESDDVIELDFEGEWPDESTCYMREGVMPGYCELDYCTAVDRTMRAIYEISGICLKLAWNEDGTRPESFAAADTTQYFYDTDHVFPEFEWDPGCDDEGDGEGEVTGDGEEGESAGVSEASAALLGGWGDADADDDGAISLEESGLTGEQFDALDLNGDDSLGIAELQFAAGALSPVHSIDADADGAISLNELLRLIQFYNADGYRCDMESEDGYAPGTAGEGRDESCPAHASDYLDADGAISLSELLRLVQYFNVGGYSVCGGSEDRFCPAAG